MYDEPGGALSPNPDGGQTVYLLLDPNLTKRYKCSDGS